MTALEVPVPDLSAVDQLRAIVKDMPPELLEAYAAECDPDDLALLEWAVAEEGGEHWRSNPARMANYLEPNEYKLWPYFVLLAERFVAAFRGILPRQVWNMPSQMGKGLSLGTPIATPTGWTTMGRLHVGDVVFGGNGEPTTVTFVAAPRVLDCWVIEFHDGASLLADGDHRWRVWDSYGHDPVAWKESKRKGAWRVVDTRSLALEPHRYKVPTSGNIVVPHRDDLPIDPYVLGVWLGDGTSSSAGLTCADEELLDILAMAGEPVRRVPYGIDPYAYTWAGHNGAPSTFRSRLRQLGVFENKHVPDPYLWADDKQRLALLQGLLDTDGSAWSGKSGYAQVDFTNTNRRLADAVCFLARSFGIRTKVRESRATIRGRDCGPRYRVSFTTDLPVFRLSRKANRIAVSPGPRKNYTRVGIREIRPTLSVPTRCIQVDSPDGTFLAGEHLTVTHNTSALKLGIVWALEDDPTKRIMYVSYDATKAVEEAGWVRDFIESHAEHLRVRLRPDKRSRGMWATPEGGGLYATGVKGGITGWPADAVLMDDMIKGWQAAHSEAEREFAWNVYRSQIRMRIQKNSDPIICAGTRWHEDDISGRLIKGTDTEFSDRWSPLRLPALAEAADPTNPDPLLRQADPLGRAVGEVLEEERFDKHEVMARAESLGSYLAAALEQQRPAPEEGGEIKRVWWKWAEAPPPRFDDACTSWDVKLKDKSTGSFVVGQAWGRVASNFWFLDQLRGQYSQSETANAIALMQVRFPWIHRHLIENTGNGPEVMEELRDAKTDYKVSDEMASALGMTETERDLVELLRRRGMPGLVPITPRGPKIVRARAVSPKIEAGNTWLVESPQARSLVEEWSSFPNGSTFDQIDATSQALSALGRSANTRSSTAARQRLPDSVLG